MSRRITIDKGGNVHGPDGRFLPLAPEITRMKVDDGKTTLFIVAEEIPPEPYHPAPEAVILWGEFA